VRRGQENGLKQNAVLSFPSDLCYVLRTIQIMRGMAMHMDVDFHLNKAWTPLAKELLAKPRRTA
jgi:hypothetical protein